MGHFVYLFTYYQTVLYVRFVRIKYISGGGCTVLSPSD